jgi:5-formyltetrahydrofolate cyclo-ligase
MDKKTLRQQGRKAALAAQSEGGAAYDNRIADLFFSSQYFMPRSVISAFVPLRGEVACMAIIKKLGVMGHLTALPVVMDRDSPMVFREYALGDSTKPGVMGQQEPLPDAAALIPDVLLIPMLGFNRAGYRLGYGTGFYDRTLESLRKHKPIKAIGMAYSTQEMPELAVETHDQPLDVLITEKEVIQIK